VFTLPSAIAYIALHNKRVVYNLLFKASAGTLLAIAAAPKHLGARIAVTSVLHTGALGDDALPPCANDRAGRGISLDGERWIACRPGFVLPVGVLSKLLRRLVGAQPASPAAGHSPPFSKPLRRTKCFI
jgi:hypothetical protein